MDAPEISAKMGINIQAVLEDDRAATSPPPRATPRRPCKALIFDSQYDAYRGVIVYFRVMEGTLTPGHGREDDGLRRRVTAWWRCGHLLPTEHGALREPLAPARSAISPPPSRT